VLRMLLKRNGQPLWRWAGDSLFGEGRDEADYPNG
jgi:hypothetical protein